MRRAWLMLVVLLVACKYTALPSIEPADGPIANDASGSGNDSGTAFAFVPLHLQQAELLPGASDVVLSSPTTIDTSSLTIAGATSSFFVQQDNNAVLYTHGFDVRSPLTITGTLPLIVVATGSIHVEADINLGAVGPVSGPGAVNAGNGGGGGTFTPGPTDERSSSGGGGGGHGTAGAAGGATGGAAGVAGVAYGMDPSGPLAGGSPGGVGGHATATELGGGGGGALQLTSEVSIVIASIAINAGGGGGSGGSMFDGGGGGGAGGELLFESRALTITGSLAANGGGGGGGGSGGSIAGVAGADATAVFQVAMGGAGAAPKGSNGGQGAYNFSATVANPPSTGSNNNSMAGGGGGGQGVVWLRYPADATPDLTGARFSPAAQTSVLPF